MHHSTILDLPQDANQPKEIEQTRDDDTAVPTISDEVELRKKRKASEYELEDLELEQQELQLQEEKIELKLKKVGLERKKRRLSRELALE